MRGLVRSFLRKNFDEAAILAVAAKVAFTPDAELDNLDLPVLAALRRCSETFKDATTPEIGTHLRGMEDEQIAGLANSVKGILHEMEFVRLENEDGDSVYASLFPNTNHPGFDVALIDQDSGESWEVQLKATDEFGAVEDWMESHPEGEILVTDELAERMGLPESGFSNEDLTVRTEDMVDWLLACDDPDSVWHYLPGIGAFSIGLLLWELWSRYQSGTITWSRFKWLAMTMTGLKAGKLGLLTVAMATPGLNVVTGAFLVAGVIHSANAHLEKSAIGRHTFGRQAL